MPKLNPSKYRSIQTTRGLTYTYYYAAAQHGHGHPTLLFLHGYPSSSEHWARIALFFENRGYGIIIPDMLGYGGTSKPRETEAYVPSKMARDLVDILDAENVRTAIAIGHDWGTTPVSRLSNHFPERFLAYAFFNIPYTKIHKPIPYKKLLALIKAKHGSELFGYWDYNANGDVEGDFRKNPDAFISGLFPKDPKSWLETIAPLGALQKTVQSGVVRERADYVSDEEANELKETFLKNGLFGPSRWYAVTVNNMAAEDNIQTIPKDRRLPPTSAPLFFGGGRDDPVCLAQVGYDLFTSKEFEKHNVTIREFAGDHWIILSHADEISRELLRWIEDIVLVKAKL